MIAKLLLLLTLCWTPPGGRHAGSCLDCYTILDSHYDTCSGPYPCRPYDPECCDVFTEDCEECCDITFAHQAFCCDVQCLDRPEVEGDSKRDCLIDALGDGFDCSQQCDRDRDKCEPEA